MTRTGAGSALAPQFPGFLHDGNWVTLLQEQGDDATRYGHDGVRDSRPPSWSISHATRSTRTGKPRSGYGTYYRSCSAWPWRCSSVSMSSRRSSTIQRQNGQAESSPVWVSGRRARVGMRSSMPFPAQQRQLTPPPPPRVPAVPTRRRMHRVDVARAPAFRPSFCVWPRRTTNRKIAQQDHGRGLHGPADDRTGRIMTGAGGAGWPSSCCVER